MSFKIIGIVINKIYYRLQINNFPEGKTYIGLNDFKLLINGSLVMNFSDGSQATYDTPSKAKRNGSSYCLDYVTKKCSENLTW